MAPRGARGDVHTCDRCGGPVAAPGMIPCEATCACGRTLRLLEAPPRADLAIPPWFLPGLRPR